MRTGIRTYGDVDHGRFTLLLSIFDDILHSGQQPYVGKRGDRRHYLSVGSHSGVRGPRASSGEDAADMRGVIHLGGVGLPRPVFIVSVELDALSLALHILHHPLYPRPSVGIEKGRMKGIYAYVAEAYHNPFARIRSSGRGSRLYGAGVIIRPGDVECRGYMAAFPLRGRHTPGGF